MFESHFPIEQTYDLLEGFTLRVGRRRPAKNEKKIETWAVLWGKSVISAFRWEVSPGNGFYSSVQVLCTACAAHEIESSRSLPCASCRFRRPRVIVKHFRNDQWETFTSAYFEDRLHASEIELDPLVTVLLANLLREKATELVKSSKL